MLAGDQWRAERLLVSDQSLLESHANNHDLPIEIVSTDRLAELTKTDEHQGMAARMPPYPYRTVDNLLAAEPRTILMLDRIQYPMNFGTMLRSAEVFGVHDIVVASSGQSDVTASVARMSAGAVFHSRIAVADDLAAAARTLQGRGYLVLATTPERGQPCDELDLTDRCVLVIGRESDGVSPELIDLSDKRVLIPQDGQTQSLNAAASAAILLYEVSRQRRAQN